MKKLVMMVMVFVMMMAMSFAAHAEERETFKKVTWFYADDILGCLPHTELSMEDTIYEDDDYTIKVNADESGNITMMIDDGDTNVSMDLAVYVNGVDMMVFYTVDGVEYVVEESGGMYAEEFYTRC